jgi:hypothetical protein
MYSNRVPGGNVFRTGKGVGDDLAAGASGVGGRAAALGAATQAVAMLVQSRINRIRDALANDPLSTPPSHLPRLAADAIPEDLDGGRGANGAFAKRSQEEGGRLPRRCSGAEKEG